MHITHVFHESQSRKLNSGGRDGGRAVTVPAAPEPSRGTGKPGGAFGVPGGCGGGAWQGERVWAGLVIVPGAEGERVDLPVRPCPEP